MNLLPYAAAETLTLVTGSCQSEEQLQRQPGVSAGCLGTQPDTLSNNALNGTGLLSLITVAVPGTFQQHSGNYAKIYFQHQV